MLSIFPDAIYERGSEVYKDDFQLIPTPKYFLFLGCHSITRTSKRLVGGYFPTIFHKSRCPKLSRVFILPCHYRSQTRAERLFCLLASVLWWSVPALIREKHHEFSLLLEILVFMLASNNMLLMKKLKKFSFCLRFCFV